MVQERKRSVVIRVSPTNVDHLSSDNNNNNNNGKGGDSNNNSDSSKDRQGKMQQR